MDNQNGELDAERVLFTAVSTLRDLYRLVDDAENEYFGVAELQAALELVGIKSELNFTQVFALRSYHYPLAV